MAIEMTNELYIKLRNAKADEAEAILKEAGQEPTAEELETLKAELNGIAEHDGESLSLDELDAVAGGDAIWVRSYTSEGCAATVEFGSNCYGTDGGCSFMNIEYRGGITNVKCDCGHYMYRHYLFRDTEAQKDLYGVVTCPYCGNQIQMDPRVWMSLQLSK